MLTIALRLFVLVVASGALCAAENFDREIVLAPQGGSSAEDAEIARWQARAGGAEATADAFTRLGWAFVARARRTLDAGDYKLAEKAVAAGDAQFGPTAESRLLRGHACHNLHRFAEAETIARGLVAERGAPADFALLSDALVEQGKLADGIVALQRFVDLRPGTEAFARIAHVRWLKGDLPGAIAALEMAERAVDARDATTAAWVLARLSGLQLQTGDAARALALADSALAHASEFPPALLARGRALLALERREDAVAVLQRATELNPLPEYQWWLADALRAAGRPEAAAKVEAQLAARGAASDPRTFALYLATRGENPALARRLAADELRQRGDVLTQDAQAWALAAAGELAAADAAMRAALAEGTQDARLALHAGEIARRGGRRAEAERHFAIARAAAGTLTPSERALLTPRPADDSLQASSQIHHP